MNDTELLQEFVRERSENAFRTLVERHLPLVFGTARRITGDSSLSEDVAQTVFVLLAQKAANLGPKTILSGWLYRTACFVAKRALLSDQRRHRRESEALTMQSGPESNPNWENITQKLDHALASLNETDRAALLLRFFEQRSYRDVGVALGLSEEAAKKRGLRALEKLRLIFRRHGIGITAAGLAAGLSQEAVQAGVAGDFASKVVLTVMAQGAAGSGAAVSSPLVNEVLTAWRWAKIKMALLSGTAVMLSLFLIPQISKLTTRQTLNPPTLSSNVQETARPKRPLMLANSVTSAATGEELSHLLHLSVLDDQTGKPIERASVTHDLLPWDPDLPTEPLRTDSNGAVSIVLGTTNKDTMTFGLNVKAEGYAPRATTWICTTGNVISTVSTQHIVRLERGVTLACTVVNEKGQPQPKVNVAILGNNYGGYTISIGSDGRISSPPDIRADEHDTFSGKSLTDENGRVEIPHFPSGLQALIVTLTGPNGATCRYRTSQGERLAVGEMPLVSFADLKRGSARLELVDGVTVEGIVVNEQGEPLSEVTVVGSYMINQMEMLGKTRTDPSGHFRLPQYPRRELLFTASKEGWATASTTAFVAPGLPMLRIVMPPEQPLRGRVVSPIGQPVSDARVSIDPDPAKNPGMGTHWSSRTDAEGRFVFRGAPTNEVEVFIAANGFAPRLSRMRASENESVITLSVGNNDSVHVTGRVWDATTGMPVEQFQTKISHQMEGSVPARAISTNEGSNGEFNLTIRPPLGHNACWVLQIEADGYEATCTRLYRLEEGDQQLEIYLQPGGAVEGLIRTPDGQPGGGAQLGFAIGEPVYLLEPGLIMKRYLSSSADANGHFKLAKAIGAHALVAVHESGWANIPFPSTSDKVEVKLQPWGRIEGVLAPGTQKGRVSLKRLKSDWSDCIAVQYSSSVDENGHFVFEYVPEGEYKIAVDAQVWRKQRYMPVAYERQTPVQVLAGETSKITLGADGRTVQARLRLGGGSADVDWSRALAVLSKKVEIAPEPDYWDYLGRESFHQAHRRYIEDPAVIAALRKQSDYIGRIGDDGTVTFDRVPPGDYVLTVKLLDLDKAESTIGNPPVLARLQSAVSIPEATEADDSPAQLGEFTLHPM